MPGLEAHQCRTLYRLFEGPPWKAELTEAHAKKPQDARVIERLRTPLLSQGIVRELRKQQSILEGEIAELKKMSPGL